MRLGDYCNIKMGQAPRGEFYNNTEQGFPLLAGAGDLGEIYPNPSRFSSSALRICSAGEIILCIRATIGKKNWADRSYCLGRGVASITPIDCEKVFLNYVWHWLTANERFLIEKGKGATFIQVNKKDIEELPCSLPSISEQRRIAAILDKAESIRRKRQQALELADDLLKSLYSKLCGHKNKEYSKWPFFTVADLSKTMFTGPFGSALRHSEFISEGIPVLGIDNAVNNFFQWGERRYISEKKYTSLKKYTVQHDDVIVTIMGTTGKSAVIPSNIGTAISTKHLATIRLNTSRALPKYLSCSFFLNQDVQEQIYKEGKGAVMPGLNLGIIKSIRLRLPPMENQKNFLHISSKLDDIKKMMQYNLQEACCSIKSLQQFFFK